MEYPCFPLYLYILLGVERERERESCPGWQVRGVDRRSVAFLSLKFASYSTELLGLIGNPLTWTQSQILISGSSTPSNPAPSACGLPLVYPVFHQQTMLIALPCCSAEEYVQDALVYFRGEDCSDGWWVGGSPVLTISHFTWKGNIHSQRWIFVNFLIWIWIDNVFIIYSIMSGCWRLSGNLLKLDYLKFCHLAIV